MVPAGEGTASATSVDYCHMFPTLSFIAMHWEPNGQDEACCR